MKTKLILFLALLALCGSRVWAKTITLDGSTGTGGVVASGFGFTLPDEADAEKVYSLSSFTVGLRGTYTYAYYLAICTEKKETGSAVSYSESKVIAVSNNAPTAGTSGRFEYTFTKPVKLVKGVTYYVQFLSSNIPENEVYSTIAQGVTVSTGADGAYPLSIYSGSGSFTKFIPNFTTTLTEMSSSESEYWRSLNSNTIDHAAVQRIKVVTPSNNNYYRLSAFSLYLCNSNITDAQHNNYMLISKKSDAVESISTNDIIGISQNHPTASGNNVEERFFFDEVSLQGNTTYYLYFTASNIPSDGSYTLCSEKIKQSSTTTNPSVWWSNTLQNWEPRYYATLDVLKKVTFSRPIAVNGGDAVSTIYVATDGSDDITLPANYKYTIGGVEMNGSQAVAAIEAAGTSDVTVTVSSPILVNNQKYRLQQAWSSTRYYLYANTSDGSNGNRLWKSQASFTSLLTDANYIWQAKSSSTNWILFNPAANSGAGRYIAKATSTSVDGTGVNALNASSADDAETFTLVSAESCGYTPSDYSSKCYVALKSNNQTNTYLNSYSTGTNYVGWHNAVHAGYYFSFIPVKTVTFSSAIAVNGGDPVSAIYVATDGSDSFTLPENYKYSFDNGENYVYASEAATTIASAGTSDLTVLLKDNSTVNIDYYVYYGGNKVAEQKDVSVYVGDPVIPSSLARDFCTYQYYTTSDMNVELETITAETEEIYVKATWAGPFDLSTSYNSATWYYWKLTDKYLYYDTSTIPYPIIADKTDAKIQYSPYALWAFMGNPYDGISILNKAAGYSKCLTSYYDEPQMDSYLDADAKWAITKQNDTKFSLKIGDKCLNNFSGNGKLRYWTNASASLDAGSALTVETVTWKELAVADVNLFALNHPTGLYFGIADEAEVNATINQIKNFAGNFTESMYNLTMSGLNTLLKLPNTGYYLIKHVGSNYYLGTDGSIPVLQSSIAPSNIARLVKGEGNSYNISVQGKYIKTNGRSSLLTIEDSPSSTISGKMLGGYVELWVGDSYCIYASTADYSGQPFGWDSYGTATQWTIEDATSITLTLNAVGDKTYGTTYLPFDVTLPAEGDVCAYTLTDSGNGWLRLNLLGENGKSIPAGTPVLLRGTSTTSVTATIADVDDIDTEGNVLSGTYLTMEHGDNLVLGKIDGVPGFYKYNFDIKPNKAYIAASAEAKAYKFMFDDEDATAIDNVNGNGNADNAAIYNIAGQRISKLQKGINIVNGKKVLY